MKSLRARVIHAAYHNEKLRPHLLPLLVKSGGKIPPQFLENVNKAKAKAKGKDDKDDSKDEKGKGKGKGKGDSKEDFLAKMEAGRKKKKKAVGAKPPSRREMERLRREAERGDSFAAELLARWEARKNAKWWDIASLEMATEERIPVKVLRKQRDFGGVQYFEMAGKGRGLSGESEWMVFKSFDDAEKYAEAYVQEQIEDEPSMFNQDWLAGFLKVDNATRDEIANDEADSYFDGMPDEEVLSAADMVDDWDEIQESIDEAEEKQEDADDKEWDKLQAKIDKLQSRQESLVEQALEKAQEEHAESVRDQLEDPLQYLRDMGMEDEGIPSWITVDAEAAAKSAINVDGVAHFLDRYDGSETELNSGAVAFGTN